MLIALKIVHLLCLALALGLTAANLVTMRYVAGLDAAARPPFGPLQRSIGAFGVMALALLWVTGIALFLLKYGSFLIGPWFHAKMAFVVILTALVITVRRMVGKAVREGTPAPADLVRKLTLGAFAAGVLTVCCAVVAFN